MQNLDCVIILSHLGGKERHQFQRILLSVTNIWVIPKTMYIFDNGTTSYGPHHEMGCPTRSDTKQAVQPQSMAKGLKRLEISDL